MIFTAYPDNVTSIWGLRLKSCGHIFAPTGREIFRPRGRGDWLLFYVAKESETFYLDHSARAEAGSFILFAPGEKQHHITTSDKTAEFYYAHFDAPADFDPSPIRTSTIYPGKASRHICTLFEEMIDETLKKQPCYHKLCILKLMELFTQLERRMIHTHHPQAQHLDQISYVIQQMNRDLSQNRTLEEYAALAGMSKYHFLRIFESITGTSPGKYQGNIRLTHAAELLEEGTMSVSEISRHTGFSSPAYFADAFKRKFGLPPTQYRKRNIK